MNVNNGIPLISVIVPVYKEELNIRPFIKRTIAVLEQLGSYEILFCLDPSPDKTEEVIRTEILGNKNIRLLVFSRRFGQPAATMAGILNCRGQWCSVIDVDLQDPPELIATFLEKANEGYDVVAGRRISREGESWLKRGISSLGYKFINKIAEVPIPPNTGDFRILSRRVIEGLRGLSESHGFLRGLVPLVGFPQTEILYNRDARHLGVGNYNRYLGSLKIGLNGIIGFSRFPLQIMMWSGFLISLLSALIILVVTASQIFLEDSYGSGVPTIIVLVLFLGGVQLASIGLLGEYVGRVYDEVRNRPLYIVDKAFNIDVRDPRGPRSGEALGVSKPVE